MLGLCEGNLKSVSVMSMWCQITEKHIVTRAGDNSHVDPKCFSLITILGRLLFLCVSENKSRLCRIHINIAIRAERFRK